MRRTASTAASVAVLALLVCACVFAAMTGPAVSLRTRTQALSQTLAATKSITRPGQVRSARDQFTASVDINNSQANYGFGESQNLTPGQLAQTQREIGHGLAQLAVPLAPGRRAGPAN